MTVMNATLLKAVVALVPACVLVLLRARTMGSILQLRGAGCLIVVVLTHVAEALRLFPAMQWGEPHSVGYYVDLSSAVLCVTLLSVGFLERAFSRSPVVLRPCDETDTPQSSADLRVYRG